MHGIMIEDFGRGNSCVFILEFESDDRVFIDNGVVVGVEGIVLELDLGLAQLLIGQEIRH